MRRVLVLGVAAMVFSLPWEVSDRDAIDPAQALAATSVESAAPAIEDSPEASSEGEASQRRTLIPIPSSGADVLELPAGDDYWTFLGSGLPDDFVEEALALDGVTAAYTFPAGTVHMTGSTKVYGAVVDSVTPGWFIPLDAAVVSPEDLILYLGADHELGADDVVLGRSSAALRRLEVGDTITVQSGAVLTVGAVVDDDVFGEPELIATTTEHFDEDRFKARAALVRTTTDIETLREGLETVYDRGARFGLHHRNEHADNGPRIVRSWVFMKQEFGEFEYRPGRGVAVEIEPAWLDENIVEVRLPLLGLTKCHTKYADVLTAVMNRLIDEGKSSVITRTTFFGCWNPRYIRGTTRLSRHSFGIAADINFSNRRGDVAGSPVHSALLDAMSDFGVHSGHVWTTPDAGHFEYYGFPDGRTGDEEGPR